MAAQTLLPDDALEAYGTILASYRGTGHLIFPPSAAIACQFIAGQLENGKTFALCATSDPILGLFVPHLGSNLRLKGETEDGLSVQSLRDLTETTYLPTLPAVAGTWLAFHVAHLEVSRPQPRARERLTYLLSNASGLDSPITIAINGISLEICPLDSASSYIERLAVFRNVLPTARVIATTTAPIEQVSETVDGLCYLLSLALGTKIQWVSLTEEAGEDWICKHHYSRVTKRYGALSLMDPAEIVALLRQSADGRFAQKRAQVGLTDAVIDTYLDAKSEGDFLQVRALKLVIAVEMLKAEYATIAGGDPLIVAQVEFDAISASIKEILKNGLPNSSPEQRGAIYSNLRGINRTPFALHLQKLCTAVQLSLAQDELNRFVYSRNKLVHEGHFYCEKATDRERAKLQPLADVRSEWFWLLHFVDRLFLRALGYEGPYIDWTSPGNPSRRHLLASAQAPNMTTSGDT
jgi:hypothetical protein